MLNRGIGRRAVVDTPTPNGGQEPRSDDLSDANITRLQSTRLARPPNTPRRQQVVDMLGDETVAGDLPHLLSELKLKLQALGPPKSNRTTASSLATLTGYSQEGPVSFKCDRVGFQNVLTLVDFCHRVATTQAIGAPELAPEALMAGVHASIQEMEAKVEDALTEQASTLAATIEKITACVAVPQPTFAQAAQADKPPARSTGPKLPKQAQPPLPPALPDLTLTQVVRGAKAEMETDAEMLAARVNTAIKVAIPTETPRIKAFKRVHRTGDIHLFFETQDQADQAAATADVWLEKLSAHLKLKTKLYTIMVHGIPTSFDVLSEREVRNFQYENGRVLDSLESIRWANTNSISMKKPFSSVFISLRDPEAANVALGNNVIYKREIRTTELSKKHPGATQCFKCQGFGHTKAACKATPRCATCTGHHLTEDCDASMEGKTYCANCTDVHVAKLKAANPAATADDISPEDLLRLGHSPYAANCPVRRAKASLTNNRDFFKVTKKNTTTHAVR